jgi:hypothetical protein
MQRRVEVVHPSRWQIRSLDFTGTPHGFSPFIRRTRSLATLPPTVPSAFFAVGRASADRGAMIFSRVELSRGRMLR